MSMLDTKDILYFVTPHIAVEFGIRPKIFSEPSPVSMAIGDSIIARKGYKSCPITVSHSYLSLSIRVIHDKF